MSVQLPGLVYNCWLPAIAWGAHSKFWTGPPPCTLHIRVLHPATLHPASTPWRPCNALSWASCRGKLPPTTSPFHNLLAHAARAGGLTIDP